MGKLTILKNSLGKHFGSIGLTLKRKSPEILLVCGIAGVVATIIDACYQTTKLDKVTGPANEKIKAIKEDINDVKELLPTLVNSEEIANYDDRLKNDKKELTKEYFKTTGKLALLYLRPAIELTASITCLGTSHHIMKTRNIALAAAYTTLDNGYKAYRERVKEALGEAAESDIFNSTKHDKKGNVTKSADANDIQQSNTDWGYCFDESNRNWQKNGQVNLTFLESIEKCANARLKANGYLFLYDVYDMLGIDTTLFSREKRQGSRVVGWVYDPDDDSIENYISFGITDPLTGLYTQAAEDMKKFGERNIWLTFNPQGDILTDGWKKSFMDYAKN